MDSKKIVPRSPLPTTHAHIPHSWPRQCGGGGGDEGQGAPGSPEGKPPRSRPRTTWPMVVVLRQVWVVEAMVGAVVVVGLLLPLAFSQPLRDCNPVYAYT